MNLELTRKRLLLIVAVFLLLAAAGLMHTLLQRFQSGVQFSAPFASKPISLSIGTVTLREPHVFLHIKGLKKSDESGPSLVRFSSLDKLSIERGYLESTYEPKGLQINAEGLSLSVANLNISGAEARLDASVPNLVLASRAGSGEKKSTLSNTTMSGIFSFAERGNLLAVRSFRLAVPPFGSLAGSANILLEKPFRFTASVEQGADINAFFAAFAGLLPEEYRAWTVQGSLSGSGSFEGSYKDSLSLKGKQTIALAGVGILDPKATKGIQGMGLSVAAEYEYSGSADRLGISLNAAVENGEYLLGKWYANLQGKKATASLQGIISTSGETRSGMKGSIDPFGVGRMALNLSWKGGDRQIGLDAPDIRIPLVVETFFTDYLKEGLPALSDMKLTGNASATVSVHQNGDAVKAGGSVAVANASFALPSKKIAVSDITARIPINLALLSTGSSATASEGFVKIGNLRVYDVSTPDMRIPLIVSTNTISTAEPVTISLAGGTVTLGHLKIAGIPAETRSVEASLTIAAVWLNQLFSELNIAPEDALYASLPLIRYRSDMITTDGAVSVSVFGGDIMVTNLFVDKPFMASRRWGGDIDFSGIDLDRVTSRIPIGKMTGVVAGSLRRLEIEYNQPARFIFDLDSVPTKGVPQSISIEAIESISIIGTGSGGFLNKGIAGLFKSFPYSRIGIRATCENDVFTIRGKIVEGGVEYLVRKGFLRGVDVVNQNPDNTISFRDMQERVERIVKNRESGGPEIR